MGRGKETTSVCRDYKYLSGFGSNDRRLWKSHVDEPDMMAPTKEGEGRRGIFDINCGGGREAPIVCWLVCCRHFFSFLFFVRVVSVSRRSGMKSVLKGDATTIPFKDRCVMGANKDLGGEKRGRKEASRDEECYFSPSDARQKASVTGGGGGRRRQQLTRKRGDTPRNTAVVA